MAGILKWYGKQVLDATSKEIDRRLDTAAIMLVNDIVKSFGSAPPIPKGFAAALKGVSAKTWRHAFRSKPGETPHVDTGTLRRSISFDRPKELDRRVGSSLKPQGGNDHSYAWFLEMGTEAMRGARPYLMPALRRMRSAMFKVIANG